MGASFERTVAQEDDQMPRKIARKTASQTAAAQKRELAALKRELKDKVKSAREAAAAKG